MMVFTFSSMPISDLSCLSNFTAMVIAATSASCVEANSSFNLALDVRGPTTAIYTNHCTNPYIYISGLYTNHCSHSETVKYPLGSSYI